MRGAVTPSILTTVMRLAREPFQSCGAVGSIWQRMLSHNRPSK